MSIFYVKIIKLKFIFLVLKSEIKNLSSLSNISIYKLMKKIPKINLVEKSSNQEKVL
jgi:hypothetical protein